MTHQYVSRMSVTIQKTHIENCNTMNIGSQESCVSHVLCGAKVLNVGLKRSDFFQLFPSGMSHRNERSGGYTRKGFVIQEIRCTFTSSCFSYTDTSLYSVLILLALASSIFTRRIVRCVRFLVSGLEHRDDSTSLITHEICTSRTLNVHSLRSNTQTHCSLNRFKVWKITINFHQTVDMHLTPLTYVSRG